jgi:hypothetical protein
LRINSALRTARRAAVARRILLKAADAILFEVLDFMISKVECHFYDTTTKDARCFRGNKP